MKKIFLSSYFKSVAALFQSFVGEELQGKTITFIPTATLTESYTAYLGAGKNALKKL